MFRSCRCVYSSVRHAGEGSNQVNTAKLCLMCEQHLGKTLRALSRCSLNSTRSLASLTLSGPSSGYVSNTGTRSVQRRLFSTKPQSRTHYYDVLGISPKATQSEIKTAYYKLSKVHHPDTNPKDAHKGMFTQISEAYEILGNRTKRRMYDNGIHSRSEAADNGDYTRPFRDQQGFGATRGPAPTGRTHQYNFDEFYRQHYSDSIRQEKVDRENFRQAQRELESERYQKKLRGIVTGLMIIFLVAVNLIGSQQPGIRNQPPKES